MFKQYTLGLSNQSISPESGVWENCHSKFYANLLSFLDILNANMRNYVAKNQSLN